MFVTSQFCARPDRFQLQFNNAPNAWSRIFSVSSSSKLSLSSQFYCPLSPSTTQYLSCPPPSLSSPPRSDPFLLSVPPSPSSGIFLALPVTATDDSCKLSLSFPRQGVSHDPTLEPIMVHPCEEDPKAIACRRWRRRGDREMVDGHIEWWLTPPLVLLPSTIQVLYPHWTTNYRFVQ